MRSWLNCFVRLVLLATVAGIGGITTSAATPSAPSPAATVSLQTGTATLTPTETWTLQFDYPVNKRADVTHFRIFNDPPGTAVNAQLLEVAASVLAPHESDATLLTATVAMPALKVNGTHLITVVARNAPVGFGVTETPPTPPLTITVLTPTAPIPGMPTNPRIRGKALIGGRWMDIVIDVDSITPQPGTERAVR